MISLTRLSGYLPSMSTFTRPCLYSNLLKRQYSLLVSDRLTRGDIVLFKGKFEGEGGEVVQAKNRPHIVISSEKVMLVTQRVALAPLSTALLRHKYEVAITSNQQTGIHEASKVMANQIRTVFLKDGFAKIGTALESLPRVDRALEICFGDFKARKELDISRGDVVQIDFGSFIRSGVIVSNDIGNGASQIAMLAHAHKKNEPMNEFDLVVNEEDPNRKELLVQCYMINTFDQGIMDKKGRILERDMDRITAILFKTLGVVRSPGLTKKQ